MKAAIVMILLSVLISAPALAGAPANGTWTSTDLGGPMLPGRYSESWYPGPLATNNTLNEHSWDGATLGTQWNWYCPWILGKLLLLDTVNGAGNGQKIWKVTYTGGYCWLDGGGPWAGGDASYLADITTWVAIVTEQYAGGVEVGTVRNHNASATFQGYNDECMSLSVTNVSKLGDTGDGPLPAGFPAFWNWIPCAADATPGEWGVVNAITFTIVGCETVSVQEKSWGAVKALYRD